MVNFKIKKIGGWFVFILLLDACNSIPHENYLSVISEDTSVTKVDIKVKSAESSQLEGNWINMKDSLPGAFFDIRYATTNNFTAKQIYPCAACYLRPEAARALMKISEDAYKSGYKILVYDCYRPLNVQKILWEIKPDAAYVTPPSVGSMHNRGLAVDLTLANVNGKPIDMGNLYDDFSSKSHWNYTNLSQESITNRNILKGLMKKYGFDTINSEWWHYSYNDIKYPIENEVWDCK